MTVREYVRLWFKTYWVVLAYVTVVQLTVLLIYKILGKVLGY